MADRWITLSILEHYPSLDCIIGGSSNHIIYWTFDGDIIKNNSKIIVNIPGIISLNGSNNMLQSKIRFVSKRKNSTSNEQLCGLAKTFIGEYQCHVTGSYGGNSTVTSSGVYRIVNDAACLKLQRRPPEVKKSMDRERNEREPEPETEQLQGKDTLYYTLNNVCFRVYTRSQY